MPKCSDVFKSMLNHIVQTINMDNVPDLTVAIPNFSHIFGSSDVSNAHVVQDKTQEFVKIS